MKESSSYPTANKSLGWSIIAPYYWWLRPETSIQIGYPEMPLIAFTTFGLLSKGVKTFKNPSEQAITTIWLSVLYPCGQNRNATKSFTFAMPCNLNSATGFTNLELQDAATELRHWFLLIWVNSLTCLLCKFSYLETVISSLTIFWLDSSEF